jgi:hypothetical protein
VGLLQKEGNSMTDLRKAAELALKALEELRFANAPFLDEAMEALRQALAQKGKECIYPECETGIGCDGPCGEKPVDTVKQEPVAWMNPRNNAVIDARKKKQLGEGDGYPRFSVPLYTQPVDETAKRGHEPGLWVVQYKDRHEFVWGAKPVFRGDTVLGLKPLYTAPPKREWVGLTDDDLVMCESEEDVKFVRAIEAKLKEKNT